MELSRPEYWSELPFPPPGDLPNPGIKLALSLLAGGLFLFYFTTEAPGSDTVYLLYSEYWPK